MIDSKCIRYFESYGTFSADAFIILWLKTAMRKREKIRYLWIFSYMSKLKIIKTFNDRYINDISFESALNKACVRIDWPFTVFIG